ncbi:hypothetical protein [Streptomyces goshikiensis]|uniref:hypothetical protein n=1 Tax=Streptomyces goshikiensis TaxID=1942 RepID=UPI0036BE3785
MSSWKENGAAYLIPGGLFCAVMIPAAVMHAAAEGDSPQACAGRIADVLDGPVFYDPSAFRQEGGYTAILPASAALVWRVPAPSCTRRADCSSFRRRTNASRSAGAPGG